MPKTLVKLVTDEKFTIERNKDDVAHELGQQALAPFVTVDDRRVSIAVTAVAYLVELPD